MSNLLPLDQRAATWGLMRTRILIGFAATLLGGALVCAGALAPSFLMLFTTQPPARDAAASASEDESRAIADGGALLAQLAPRAGTSSPSTATAQAIALRPKGIHIAHVSYTSKPQTLIITGDGPREAVSAYRTLLAGDSRFASVVVPINALVGADNGSFTLTITGTF